MAVLKDMINSKKAPYDEFLGEETYKVIEKLYDDTFKLEKKLGLLGFYQTFKPLAKKWDKVLIAWNDFIRDAEDELLSKK